MPGFRQTVIPFRVLNVEGVKAYAVAFGIGLVEWRSDRRRAAAEADDEEHRRYAAEAHHP